MSLCACEGEGVGGCAPGFWRDTIFCSNRIVLEIHQNILKWVNEKSWLCMRWNASMYGCGSCIGSEGLIKFWERFSSWVSFPWMVRCSDLGWRICLVRHCHRRLYISCFFTVEPPMRMEVGMFWSIVVVVIVYKSVVLSIFSDKKCIHASWCTCHDWGGII